MDEAAMKPLTMQPTFVIELAVPPKVAIEKLRVAIATEGLRDHAQSAGSCLDFLVETDQRRFWSPHLSVQVSEIMPNESSGSTKSPKPTGLLSENASGDTDDEVHSELYCRFSPRPEIWTMFMAIYAVIIAAAFVGAIHGYVQWFMGAAPWSLVIVPLGILLIAGLHTASLVGQRLSIDQMQTLRGRLAESIDIAFGKAN